MNVSERLQQMNRRARDGFRHTFAREESLGRFGRESAQRESAQRESAQQEFAQQEFAHREFPPSPDVDSRTDYGSTSGYDFRWGLGGLWQGLLGRSLEMAEVQEEVAAEQFGRVAIVGADPTLNCRLLARLRQQPPVPGHEIICREGFFTLVHTVPLSQACAYTDPTVSTAPSSPWDAAGLEVEPQELVDAVADHDLLIYLFSAQAGWQAQDAHWYARLRAARVPLLPVAVKPEGDVALPDEDAELGQAMRRRIGVCPAFVHLRQEDQFADEWEQNERDEEVERLVHRLLELRPRLAVPLAQEVPACRSRIAQRVIRTGALVTFLLGSEPIPLLDLPLHVAAQWKVALQLAAIYGRPGLDFRSREMVGTLAMSLTMRHLAQQILKLIPLVGWLLSGLLSGASTWFMGQALVRYYQEQQVISLPWWRPVRWREAARRGVRTLVTPTRVRRRSGSQQEGDAQTIPIASAAVEAPRSRQTNGAEASTDQQGGAP